MNTDPLAAFRKKTASTPSESAFSGADEYVAFQAKDRVERLKIKCANHPTHAPGYAYLLNIIYDGGYGTEFVLVYTIMGVKVRGKNLQSVIMSLLAGTCDFIQEFDKTRWPKITDANMPVIESIELVVQENAQPAANTGSTSL